jgi:hypothetical protein
MRRQSLDWLANANSEELKLQGETLNQLRLHSNKYRDLIKTGVVNPQEIIAPTTKDNPEHDHAIFQAVFPYNDQPPYQFKHNNKTHNIKFIEDYFHNPYMRVAMFIDYFNYEVHRKDLVLDNNALFGILSAGKQIYSWERNVRDLETKIEKAKKLDEQEVKILERKKDKFAIPSEKLKEYLKSEEGFGILPKEGEDFALTVYKHVKAESKTRLEEAKKIIADNKDNIINARKKLKARVLVDDPHDLVNYPENAKEFLEIYNKQLTKIENKYEEINKQFLEVAADLTQLPIVAESLDSLVMDVYDLKHSVNSICVKYASDEKKWKDEKEQMQADYTKETADLRKENKELSEKKGMYKTLGIAGVVGGILAGALLGTVIAFSSGTKEEPTRDPIVREKTIDHFYIQKENETYFGIIDADALGSPKKVEISKDAVEIMYKTFDKALDLDIQNKNLIHKSVHGEEKGRLYFHAQEYARMLDTIAGNDNKITAYEAKKALEKLDKSSTGYETLK